MPPLAELSSKSCLDVLRVGGNDESGRAHDRNLRRIGASGRRTILLEDPFPELERSVVLPGSDRLPKKIQFLECNVNRVIECKRGSHLAVP